MARHPFSAKLDDTLRKALARKQMALPHHPVPNGSRLITTIDNLIQAIAGCRSSNDLAALRFGCQHACVDRQRQNSLVIKPAAYADLLFSLVKELELSGVAVQVLKSKTNATL